MIERIRSTSILLSSNWYKKYKVPYLILIFDIFFIILTAIFSVKDYLVGYFDVNYPYNGILILIILSILLIVRFNISLLMFSKQNFGIFLSILYLLSVILIELGFSEFDSPFILVYGTITSFINEFIFKLPDFLNTLLVYFFYLLSMYGPLIYYTFLHLRKKKLSKNARKFDIMTGFYASTLSKRLKIMDMVVYGFLIGLAMTIGLISKDIIWSFLSVPLSLYSLFEFFKRLNFPSLTKKKKRNIYIVSFIISFGIIFTQRIPYLGFIFFVFSIFFMLFFLSRISKSFLRSVLVIVYAFIIIPVFCMGYNIFAFPQYGVIKKSIPYEDEKVFYYVVDKDGLYGVRNRKLKVIEPTYIEIAYPQKNKIMLLNQDSVWETYQMSNNAYFLPVKKIEVIENTMLIILK